MNKVYRVTVVGPTNHFAFTASENVIANNQANALDKMINKYPMDTIWSSNVEFKLKETIKLWILNMLGLESIKLELKKK